MLSLMPFIGYMNEILSYECFICSFKSITRAYGRVDADGSRYLLGDHNGLLHLLVITHEKEKCVSIF